MAKRACRLLEAFRDATKVNTQLSFHLKGIQRWTPPPDGMYKINFDGAVFNDLSNSGVGVIIRDYRGDYVAALAKRVHCRGFT